MTKILFVFNWLVVGGEETEVRLLARNLDPSEYRIDVVACFRKDGMSDQTHLQLEAAGVRVDKTPYTLSFEDTVAYLAQKMAGYDLVVACQAVPDVYPALEMMDPAVRPPLIEHGGLVEEALRGPKQWTARYVGVCAAIRDAAASRLAGREHHSIEIPSMVDLGEFSPDDRQWARREMGVEGTEPLVGWVGRLDRKKRVEDFIMAAVFVRETHPDARFVVIGGPDAFMPEYAGELARLVEELGLSGKLRFTGDRPDVPRLLSGLDAFVWLARGEGMPHVISEAGAAGLPVIATRDNGTEEQIEDGLSGLFVPHESPQEVAARIRVLLDDPDLRARLGANLRAKVEREYSTEAVVPMWRALFTEVLEEHQR